MSNQVKTGSVVFRCTEMAMIEEVLFSSIPLETKNLLNRPFSELAKSDSLDPMLHFLEALKQFGSAEGWHIPVLFGQKQILITFSGLAIDKGFIIVGNIFQQAASTLNTINAKPSEIGMNAQISLEDNQPFTSEMDESELLDELSRLNNELINSKRELVRQNVELERLKKKDKP